MKRLQGWRIVTRGTRSHPLDPRSSIRVTTVPRVESCRKRAVFPAPGFPKSRGAFGRCAAAPAAFFHRIQNPPWIWMRNRLPRGSRRTPRPDKTGLG